MTAAGPSTTLVDRRLNLTKWYEGGDAFHCVTISSSTTGIPRSHSRCGFPHSRRRPPRNMALDTLASFLKGQD